MNLLNEWKKKKSWNKTLQLCPAYYVRNSNLLPDISLSNTLNQCNSITIDVNSQTGIKEIGIKDFRSYIPENFFHLCQPKEPNYDFDVTGFANILIEKLFKYIEDVWDNNVKHLVFHSGGRDSRIISYILSQMRNESPDFIGDIHFVCHEPEGELFKKVMKIQGWKESQYSVYNDGVDNRIDYYDWGDFKNNVGAFYPPGINFHEHVVHKDEENKVCIVSGNFGGEQFNYRAADSTFSLARTKTNNRLDDMVRFAGNNMCFYSEGYNKWFDILQPYLSYEFLNTSFRIPEEMITTVNGQRGTDNIRDTMLELLGNKLPFHVGHAYNVSYSEKKRQEVNRMFRKSKFYGDFSENYDIVKNADPGKDLPQKTISTKLYGLATAYQEAIGCE
jgi:hypothetical protein